MSKERDSLLIAELLRQTTSQDVVSGFLKAKGLPHSFGTWDDLHQKRLLPLILEDQLKVSDLVELLREVEETGRQHVFLYKCAPPVAADLLDMAKLKPRLAGMGLATLLSNPKLLDQPKNPTISDVRLETVGAASRLVAKVVEQREYKRKLSDEHKDGLYVVTYKPIQERGVNVVRLHSDGLLEIRIASHKNTSDYTNDLASLTAQIKPIVPIDKFGEVSTTPAKEHMMSKRAALSSLIRFSDSTLRNDKGTVMRTASGAVASDLMQDADAVDAIARFSKTAHCEAQNIYFLAQPPLKREIRVMMAGHVNEFVVTSACSASEYEYVFGKIRSFNG